MGEDATWGRTTVEAFAKARFRLLLSGTPFRSDNSPIPWVSLRRRGHLARGLRLRLHEALVDGVCRPVTFHTYGGDMEWVSDGRVRRADFDVVLPAGRGRAAAADRAGPGRRLDHARPARRRRASCASLRAGEHPEAGGLVVAIDKEHADKLADRLARITGERPDIVHSDAADASARIARFSAGRRRGWSRC